MRKILTLLLSALFFVVKSFAQVPVEIRPDSLVQHIVRKAPPGDEIQKNCEDNEIYIVDGDRTLVLTNNKMARDINRIQNDEKNLANQIRNQDRVIQFLKLRLNETEQQLSEYFRIIEAQESTHTQILAKLNSREVELVRVESFNAKLLIDTERQRKQIENDERRIFEFKEQLRKKDQDIEMLQRQVNGETNQVIQGIRLEEKNCQEKLRLKETDINNYIQQEQILRERISNCQSTCTNKTTSSCQWMKNQLSEQDKTIFLIKDQITSQSKSMSILNTLLHRKQSTIENLNFQIKSQVEAQDMMKTELIDLNKLIDAQSETISLLKQIDRDEDYMRSAKDIALKILQNTVYTMVNDIKTCSQEIIKGLENRIHNLEAQQQPLEIMITKMRETLATTEKMESLRLTHKTSLGRIISSQEKIISLIGNQSDRIKEMQMLCSKEFSPDPQLLEKLRDLYRPINELNCKPLCNGVAVYREERYCQGLPEILKRNGLISQNPNEAAKIGDALSLICKNGPYQDQLSIYCRPDGRFEMPPAIPRCILV